jgi:hypothetical protein
MTLPPQTLTIVHDCTCVSPEDLASIAVALGTAFREHFDPLWDTQTGVVFAASIADAPAGSWPIVVRDEPPPAEAADLGYHTQTGEPRAYVYAKAAIEAGVMPSVPISHEAFEMRGDPNTNLTVPMVRNGVSGVVAQELCDACQDPRYGVSVEGLNGQKWLISAILTREWFKPDGVAPYSFPTVPEIDGPGKQGAACYIPWKPDGGQWEQIFAESAGPLQVDKRLSPGSRFNRLRQTDQGLTSAAGGL